MPADATPTRHRARRLALAVVLLLGGLYALTAAGHTDSSDGEGYFQQSRALLRGDHALELDADDVRITPSRPGRDGEPAAVGGIGYPAAMAPFTAAGALVARAVPADQAGLVERLVAGFANPLLTALTAAALLLAALRLGAPPRGALLLALAYGLGTMAWPHSGSFFSEPLTALLLTLGVLAALRVADEGRLVDVALAGVATGAAVLARPSAIVFVPIVGLYVLWVRARAGGPRAAGAAAGAYAVGALACLALSALGNWWRYGDGGDSGYASVPLDGSLAEGLYGLLLSPGKSLFLYAPIALVAIAAVPLALRRRRAETVMLGALVLSNLIVFARFPYWHGDAAWGPRYLQITLPVMILIAAPAIADVRWRRAAAVAGAVGVVPALLGTLVAVNQYTAVARERVSAEVAADGSPAYWDDLHFSPRHSPLVGHAELLPEAISTSAARLDGADASFAASGLMPTSASQRYFWYHEPPQLDVWPYWVVAGDAPGGLLLLAVIPLAALVGGAVMIRRDGPGGIVLRRAALVAGLTALAALGAVALLARLGPASGGAPVEVATRAGFGPVDVRADGRTRWLEADAGTLVVTVRDRERPVVLDAELSAFAQPRRVTLSLDGRRVGGGTVPAGGFATLTADLGTLAPGRHEVVVAAAPGPQSIAATVGVPDPRSVSVRLRALAVREGPA